VVLKMNIDEAKVKKLLDCCERLELVVTEVELLLNKLKKEEEAAEAKRTLDRIAILQDSIREKTLKRVFHE